MTKSILVPLDGSPASEAALPLAVAVARAVGAHVELVHVHELAPLLGNAPVLDTALDTDVGRGMGQSVAALAERLTGAAGVPVTATLLMGPVAASLQQHAADQGTHLIVMSTHGRGGLTRAWLGSVADRLIRSAPAPVLLVRPDTAPSPQVHWPPARVLLPLDASAQSEDALAPVLDLVDRNATELLLLSVVEMFPPLDPFSEAALTIDGPEAQAAWAAANDERRQLADEHLRRVADEPRRHGAPVRTRVVVDAPAARTILEYAKETDAGLIALTTHGRNPVTRAFMGSVADKVVRGANVPVLVVPPPAARAAGGGTESR